MGPIICCTDFSPPSTYAGSVAASLAAVLGRPLELVHALPPASDVSTSWPVSDRALETSIREVATPALAAQKKDLWRPNLGIDTHLLPGPSYETLVEHAARTGASLLVLGTHGRTAAGRLLLGSVAERVVRTASCAVLVVRERPTDRLRHLGHRDRLRLVVGVDASPASDAAIAWTRALRGRTACDLTFLHLYSLERERARLGIEERAQIVEVLEHELSRQVAEMPGHGKVELRVLAHPGDKLDPFRWEAELDEADLLVLGTSQTRHSTAIEAIRSVSLPVVCVPQAARAALDREPGHHDRLAAIRRVLVATDLAQGADGAIREGYRLVGPGGLVDLLQVIELPPGTLSEQRLVEHQAQLRAAAGPYLERADVSTQTTIIESMAPAEAIVQAIARTGADAAVVASRRRSNAAKVFVGSVADEVVRRSPKPVLVVPAA